MQLPEHSFLQKPGASNVLSYRTRRTKRYSNHWSSACRNHQKSEVAGLWAALLYLVTRYWHHFPNPSSSALTKHQLKIGHVFSWNHFLVEAVAGVTTTVLFSANDKRERTMPNLEGCLQMKKSLSSNAFFLFHWSALSMNMRTLMYISQWSSKVTTYGFAQ